MNPPTPGLRRIRYDAVSPAKVDLVVQPGDELEVSDDVAGQLERSSPQFKPVETAAKKSAPAKKAAAKKKAKADG